jgi:hypothetical protein
MPLKVTGRQDLQNSQAMAFSPQTQQDIVNNLYPQGQVQTKTWAPDTLPGLNIDLTSKDEIEAVTNFIWMTFRMRAITKVWELGLTDKLNDGSTKWTTLADDRRVRGMDRKTLAGEIANRLANTPKIAGVRVSVDKGLQIATSDVGGKLDKRLTIMYRET